MNSSSPRPRLPAWYSRVTALRATKTPEILEPADVCPDDFDEDISSIEYCDCDSDDCECESSRDDISIRSYDGPDADFYYELKDLREDRKEELLDLAREKQAMRDKESRKMEEVRGAYEALKKAEKESETLSMGRLIGKFFRLYSTDYFDHYTQPWHRFDQKQVEFYSPEEGASGNRRIVMGDFHLDTNTGCSFRSFRPPAQVGRSTR
jgi:hypothetical protein